MGLFDDAKLHYGGQFYREFSQAFGSPDLEAHFFDLDSVAGTGICAAACFDWIHHYLTAPMGHLYSNRLLEAHRVAILNIQTILRRREQNLAEFLVLCGLTPTAADLYNREFRIQDLERICDIVTNTNSINVFSYLDPQQGRHVVVSFVDRDKRMYFMDVHKGDVWVPFPNSRVWIHRYLDLFLKKYSSITLSQFRPLWNAAQATQAYQRVLEESRLARARPC